MPTSFFIGLWIGFSVGVLTSGLVLDNMIHKSTIRTGTVYIDGKTFQVKEIK
jgi:hypothetical protein